MVSRLPSLQMEVTSGCRDCISIAQYDQYYGEASATPIAGELGGGHEIIEVTPADVQRMAEGVRLARGEAVVGSGDPVTTSSVFVIESSLKNCWGLVELNKVSDILSIGVVSIC